MYYTGRFCKECQKYTLQVVSCDVHVMEVCLGDCDL